jgi:hypothetical protein
MAKKSGNGGACVTLCRRKSQEHKLKSTKETA